MNAAAIRAELLEPGHNCLRMAEENVGRKKQNLGWIIRQLVEIDICSEIWLSSGGVCHCHDS